MNRDWQQDMELCEKATRGPWREFIDSYGHNIGTKMIDPQLKAHAPVVTLAMSAFGSSVYISQSDSDFIIAAREALPYWLDETKRLREINLKERRRNLSLEIRLKASKARENKLRDAIDTVLEMGDLNPGELQGDQKGLYEAAKWYLSGIVEQLDEGKE